MKQVLYLLLLLVGSGMLFSCHDDDDDIDSVWKQNNENAFNEKALNPSFRKTEIPGGPGAIYYRVLESSPNPNGARPLYTDIVRVSYTGKLITDKVFDEPANPLTFRLDGQDFSIDGVSYTGFSVISGWLVALQNMRVGDQWEVWIPWGLGYGSGGSGSIPGYSTLIFTMKLEAIF